MTHPAPCPTCGNDANEALTRVSYLETALAAANMRYVGVGTQLANNKLDLEIAHSRIAELEAAADSENETYRFIMSENCPTDLHHCTCVPILRSRCAELETAKAAANMRHEALLASKELALKIAYVRIAELNLIAMGDDE